MNENKEQQQIKLGKIIYNLSKKNNFNLLYYYISKIINSTDNLALTLNKIEKAISFKQSDLELLYKLKEINDEISDRKLDELCAFYNE
ncbi:MAG: hypothetical protein ACOX1L_03355 [Erysipelotrichaceae bacterium]|jgi:hypothetical protein